MMTQAASSDRPLPPYSDRDQSGEKPRFGKGINKFTGVFAARVLGAPVFTGEIIAQAAHRAADFGKVFGFTGVHGLV
jgi:hypothetical protein